MADTLYLSLWYPNLRLAELPGKLTAVLGAFAAHGGEARVYSATVWPINWNEPPVFQQVYGRRIGAGSGETGKLGAEPRFAVEEALELLHDDFAYEFQIGWSLWELESDSKAGPSTPLRSAQDDRALSKAGPSTPLRSAQDDRALSKAGPSTPLRSAQDDSALSKAGPSTALRSAQDDNLLGEDDRALGKLDPRWAREPRLARVTGFGPLFDEGAYEADGHIRVDFGSDAPFLEEDLELDSIAARHVEENVRQLVELTAAVEKASGATARLLWSELGESLAQRLAARLRGAN
jgi:hypothetical protein